MCAVCSSAGRKVLGHLTSCENIWFGLKFMSFAIGRGFHMKIFLGASGMFITYSSGLSHIPIGFPNLYWFQWIPIVGGQTHPFWHPMIWVSLTQMFPLGELMAIASRAMNDGHFCGCNCFSSWNKLKWIPNVCDFFGCPKILTVDLYVSH